MTVATLALLAALSTAQPATKPQPSQPAPARPSQPEPSLDDLLGLPKAKPAERTAPPAEADDPTPEPQPGPAPIDPAKAELQRQLSAKEVDDLFNQAVLTMDQTAVRLVAARDAGIDTQRMQEDVIRKLDTLIDQAKKQQSKSKSKSKQKQQQDQQNQQSQQSQQQSSQSQNQSRSQDSNNQGAGPSRTDGPGNTSPGGTAAWGNLPEHIREALSQGKDDRYSSIYRALTEKYYKRLAEEPRPGAQPSSPPNP